MIVFSAILILLTSFYGTVLLALIIGFSRLKIGTESVQPFVSVIIAARNEEADLPDCLDALVEQDYPQDLFEVIVIDDRSRDRTGRIVSDISKTDSRFRLIQIRDIDPRIAPKKRAIHTAIREAHGEIILTTDADCAPPPRWIASIAACFRDDVGMVAGFSPLNRSDQSSLLQKLILLDGIALAGVAAGSAGIGYPLTCSGRNLAYRKEAYHDAGGMEAIGRFISGDDDLLLHQIKKTGWKILYTVDPESAVPSRPVSTFRAFFQQRTRHASKGKHYSWGLKTGLIAVYLLNLMILMGLCIPAFRIWSLTILLIKAVLEFILVARTAHRFGRTAALKWFPLAELLHIPYVLIFGLWGQLGRFRWKGESFTATTPKDPA